jgi:Protein of unknown function (DUF3761)
MFRALKAAAFAFALVAISGIAQTTISARDTAKHLGKWETVCGAISDEYDAQPTASTDSARFIHLDGYDAFNVVTWYQDHKSVGSLPVTGNLCVKGLVRKYRPEALMIFEPCPKGEVCTYHNGRSTGGTEVVLRTAGSWYVPQQETTPPQKLSNDRYYTNSDGQRVHSPAFSSGGVPAGATALCRDGTYSFSQHRSGTCSHHGGVAQWLQ